MPSDTLATAASVFTLLLLSLSVEQALANCGFRSVVEQMFAGSFPCACAAVRICDATESAFDCASDLKTAKTIAVVMPPTPTPRPTQKGSMFFGGVKT